MDALSSALTRICDEILSLREERERFLSGLQLETTDRKRAVSRMLARFAKDLAEIARRRRDVRRFFLPDLKRTVLRLRQRQDRQGATEAHGEEHSRWKTDEAEPAREAMHVRMRIERGRRRKSVRHPHRP